MNGLLEKIESYDRNTLLIELLMQNFHSSFVATTLRNNGKFIPMLVICFPIFEKIINGKFPV